MDRNLFVIESPKGYLFDIEKYTDDVLTAPSFTNYDFALKRLFEIYDLLTEECWVTSVLIPFPHPVGIRFA
jgi:hypothetical protein